MAGGSHPKSSTHKPSSSSTPAPHRKSRWESTSNNNNNPPPPQSNQKLPKPNPSPKPNTGRSPKPATPTAGPIQPSQVPPFPFPDLGPPPPPTYGFHMLERRTIMLADGSVRSYLALPPDYQDFPRPPLPPRFLHGGPTPEFLPGGPRFPPRSPDVLGFQNQNKRKFEEELVKHGNISSSNYSNNNSIGRNYTLGGAGTSNVGDEMRAGKQMRISSGDGVGFVSSNNNRNVGEVNQSELKKAFLHFVKVINENESDRKKYLEDGKQGRLQCVACGRSRICGWQVKVLFGGDQSGLKEAVRLADHFEKDNRGREAWGCIQPLTFGKDDEKNPNLVKVDRSGEKNRILYGYLATVADLYKVDFETRKKVVIESHQEHKASKWALPQAVAVWQQTL
ncbi:hypothetical protein NC653_024979 [Populus alba x Populus x berolinensis]|uniref:XS domain-containing protein n=1 Tax=Populus alba x Populus x berolinensis TaxID=444605 RepID=A0AAD6MA54_9ROSI|nr:hypothetical protein NC653_024979 [Populus alba x Populus x berolinensis]